VEVRRRVGGDSAEEVGAGVGLRGLRRSKRGTVLRAERCIGGGGECKGGDELLSHKAEAAKAQGKRGDKGGIGGTFGGGKLEQAVSDFIVPSPCHC